MSGTTRRFSCLGFVLFLGSLVAVACSSEPSLEIKGNSGGARSTTGTGSTASTTTDTSSGASTSTGRTKTGTGANEGGNPNTDGSTDGEGGSAETGTEPSSSKGGSTSTRTGKGQGGAGNTGTREPMGGSINFGDGGSRFGEALAGAGPGCNNAEKDEGETDVDCGGSCAPARRCEAGQGCTSALDCYSSSCIEAVCKEPVVIIKNAGCINATATTTCPTVEKEMRVRVQLMNVTAAPLDIKGMEIRYYLTNEFADGTSTSTIQARVDDNSFSTIKGGAYSVSIEAMETPTPTADSYVSIKITGGTIAPDKDRRCDRSAEATDCAEMEMMIFRSDYQGTIDPSNDYSFVPASGYVNNAKITVHKGTDVIWGVPPS